VVWRATLREVVRAFTKGDYCLACGVVSVDPVSAEQAKQIQAYVVDYGATFSGSVSETTDGYRFTLRLVYVPQRMMCGQGSCPPTTNVAGVATHDERPERQLVDFVTRSGLTRPGMQRPPPAAIADSHVEQI
jgi:hypothetical protein